MLTKKEIKDRIGWLEYCSSGMRWVNDAKVIVTNIYIDSARRTVTADIEHNYGFDNRSVNFKGVVFEFKQLGLEDEE